MPPDSKEELFSPAASTLVDSHCHLDFPDFSGDLDDVVARASGLPLVIHSRAADGDTAAILREELAKGRFSAVLHCYTGGRELAEQAIALGLFISFTGILTFKKSDELRAIAKSLPSDRILVETDAPYLAPGRHRGKRNEPAFVVETARVLAETRGVSLAQLARQTSDNFFRLFSKVPRPAAAAA